MTGVYRSALFRASQCTFARFTLLARALSQAAFRHSYKKPIAWGTVCI